MTRRCALYAVLLSAALLFGLMSVCAACTTSTDAGTPASAPTQTNMPTLPPSQKETVAPEMAPTSLPEGETALAVTPTESFAEVVASRTPEPTREPGPIDQVVTEVTAATGLAEMAFLGLTGEDWVNAAISLLLVLISVPVATRVVRTILHRFLKPTRTDFDDVIVKKIDGPITWLLMTAILKFNVLRLDFISGRSRIFLDDLFFFSFVCIICDIFWQLLDLAALWYEKGLESAEEEDERLAPILPLLVRTGRITILFIGASIVLQHFGISITALLATLGVAGLALSLAAQDTLADVISGVIIFLDQPFRIGDRIEIQGLGTWGDVVDIGTRTTRIRTRDNRLVIVPNSMIGSNQIVNYTYPDPRYRVQIEIGIGYGSDIENVRRTIEGAVSKVEGVLTDKPVDALFLEFGDSAMVFRVRWWIDSYVDTRRMFDRVNEALYAALDAAGVEMPFTTYDVNVKLGAQEIDRISGPQ